jgi:type IV secretion system protein VirB10
MVRFDELILPNGYTISLSANVTQAGTGGGEKVDPEGKVKGDTEKGHDAGTIASTTMSGASVGAIAGAAAGSVGKGAAIGTGAGAAIGLLGVLLTRGPDVQLPRGTTIDVMLDRELVLDASRIKFTDAGRSTVLPAPADRSQDRSRVPLSRFPFPY